MSLRAGWVATWWLAAAVSLPVCSAQSIGQRPLGTQQPAPLQPQQPQQQELPTSRPPHNAATVIQLQGQVSMIKDPELGPRATPWALNVGDTVSRTQMVETGADGHAVFQLEDGSTIEVFPNSKWTFRENSSWTDVLDLWLGKVKVHIQKWGGQPNEDRDRIHTPTAVISVRGTTFEISVNPEDDATTVLVYEGIVDVRHRLIPQGDVKTLTAGDQITVYRDVPLARATIDKGGLIRRAADVARDALYQIWSQRGAGPIPSGGGGGTPVPGGGASPGDTQAPDPPPPPPPGDAGGPAPPPAP